MFSTYFIQDCTNLSSQNHIKNFYACIEARFFSLTVHTKSNGPTLFKYCGGFLSSFFKPDTEKGMKSSLSVGHVFIALIFICAMSPSTENI